jgi:hypothetical protein
VVKKYNKLYRVVVNFKDNDFLNTYKGVMKMVGSAYINQPIELSKTQIVKMVNKLTPVAYTYFQGVLGNEEQLDVALNVEEKDVYINEEVAEFLSSDKYFQNYSVVCLDFDYNHTAYWVNIV